MKYKTISLIEWEERLKKEKSIIERRYLKDKIDNEIKEIRRLERLISKPIKRKKI